MKKLNSQTIRTVLEQITFTPSCVDMHWEWEVAKSGTFGPGIDHGGWLLRTTFARPDRDTGKIAKGFGRWWHVPEDATIDGVVKTAFAACKMILEHELMEAFHYTGSRIFDPHNSVFELSDLADKKRMAAAK